MMHSRKLWSALFVTASLGASTQAIAGYTVIDDDLFPSSRVEPTRYEPRSEVARTTRAETSLPRTARSVEEKHAVPFSKYYSALTPEGRAKLDELVPEMQGATVRIVGRPDAMYYASGQLQPLARNRANTMRSYLLRQGVPASNITVEVDTSPNPQANGQIYPSQIYISYPDRRASPTAEALSYAPSSRYQAPTAQPMPIPASGINGISDQKRLQYIYQAVQAGYISPATALKLVQEMLDGNPANVYSPRPVGYMQQGDQAAPHEPAQGRALPIQAAQPVPVQQWVLDKRLTLKDNIDAWSKAAGWNPTQWDASNFYQVTVTTTIDGNFPDVLRQVADSTGLNICAKVREKYVRVTDSNVSCK